MEFTEDKYVVFTEHFDYGAGATIHGVFSQSENAEMCHQLAEKNKPDGFGTVLSFKFYDNNNTLLNVDASLDSINKFNAKNLFYFSVYFVDNDRTKNFEEDDINCDFTLFSDALSASDMNRQNEIVDFGGEFGGEVWATDKENAVEIARNMILTNNYTVWEN